jgi:hypothetical protein
VEPRPGTVSVRKKLARSFVSVSVGLLVIALLAAMAAVMIGTSPLWLWLVPAAVEQPTMEPEAEPEQRGL